MSVFRSDAFYTFVYNRTTVKTDVHLIFVADLQISYVKCYVVEDYVSEENGSEKRKF